MKREANFFFLRGEKEDLKGDLSSAPVFELVHQTVSQIKKEEEIKPEKKIIIKGLHLNPIFVNLKTNA